MLKKIIFIGTQFLFSMHGVHAQNELSVSNTRCGSLQAQLPLTSGFDQKEHHNVFILYKQISTGVWCSDKKKLTTESSVHFEKLESNLYRINEVRKNAQIFYGLNDRTQQKGITSDPIEVHSCNQVYKSNGKQEMSSDMGIQIFPNPAVNEIFITSNLDKNTSLATLRMMNATGSTVLETTLTGDLDNVNIQTLPNGYYFINVMVDQGIIYKAPFIVSKK